MTSPMEARLIDHIGILVPDLEAAIARWTEVTGYTFSPISRYRTRRYVDHSDSDQHYHDARIAFSKEGPPYIELMEFHGNGTHSSEQGEGFHHFGFLGAPNNAERIQQFAQLGVGDDGRVYDDSDRVILWFTEKSDLNGIRLEFVDPAPSPLVKDDGSEPYRDADGVPGLWP